MKTKITTIVSLFLLLLGAYANRIVVENYGMSNRIASMAFDSDGTLWLATPGGLIHNDYERGRLISHFHNPEDFPDIDLRALTFDTDGDLWIGSEKGILYRRDKAGNQEAFHDLELSGAEITTLLYYEGLLFVGHRQGISVFEKKSLSYRGTAEQFGNLSNKIIRDIKIKSDTLYAVFSESASDVLVFPDVSKAALTIAFSTPASWRVLSLVEDDVDKPKIGSIQFDAQLGIIGFPDLSLKDGDEYVYNKDSTIIRGYYAKDTITTETGISIIDSFHVTDKRTLEKLKSLQIRGAGEVVAGTEWMSYYKYPFEGKGRQYFPGLRKYALQKLYLQRDGALWVIPDVSTKSGRLTGKNDLIRLTNNEYKYFGNWNEGFGTMGRSDVFKAVSEGPDGAMWFGNSGDFIKRYKDGKWGRLIYDKVAPFTESPFWEWGNEIYPDSIYEFPKVEGLFVDNDNTLWSTMWHNNKTPGKPMFFVYNEASAQYRYWGEMPQLEKSPYYIVEGAFKNKLFSFRNHKETEFGEHYLVIKGDVDIFDSTLSFESLVLDRDTCVGKIHDVVASESGIFVIATTGGVEARYYHQAENNPVKAREVSDIARSIALGQSNVLTEQKESVDGKVTTKEFTQTDLWVGIRQSGIALYYLKEYWNPNNSSRLDSVVITKDSSFSLILDRERLVATSPNSMVYDKKNDHLWVASDNGLSRVFIQRNTIPREDNKDFYLFPNPYRKSEHSEVTLKNVAKDAFVDVYTSSGQLVEHITREGDFFVEEDKNGIYFYKWTPSSKLAPGTYFVIAKDEERSSVVLQKLLILP